jgi:membrane-associated phospholipid phosphatase
MSFRQFLFFTAVTIPACLLLILFLDQPLALFVHRYLAGGVPFFAAYTTAADNAYETSVRSRLLGLPALYVVLALGFVLGRWVLKRRWGTLFLIMLLAHIASQGSSNVLKGVVHRLRPEVLFAGGYPGTGLWAPGPHNDSFPSTHTAIYFSLFMPLVAALPRVWAPLLVLPGLIGLGRLVLGAHYLSDVLFSLWLVVAYTFLFGLLGKPRAAGDPLGPE